MSISRKEGRKPGTPKTGGRKKGTPNKVSGKLKEWLAEFIDNSREQIVKDFKRLGPKNRVAMFEKLIKYVLPIQQVSKIDFGAMSEETLDEIINRLNNPNE